MFTSDQEIREIIPNIQKTATGETSWLSRLAPWISEALQFAVDNITGTEDVSELTDDPDAVKHLREFVAFFAWAKALPMLDLVATPNGFGIVSTQNVAPASKERVAAAQSSAYSSATHAAYRLINVIRKSEIWNESPVAENFFNVFGCPRYFNSLLVSLGWLLKREVQSRHGIGSDIEIYFKFLPEIQTAQMEIEAKILGPLAMNRLKQVVDKLNCGEAVSDSAMSLIQKTRKMVMQSILGTFWPSDARQALIAFDRIEPDDEGIIDEWHKSSQFFAFKSPDYENKEDSSAYFF